MGSVAKKENCRKWAFCVRATLKETLDDSNLHKSNGTIKHEGLLRRTDRGPNRS